MSKNKSTKGCSFFMLFSIILSIVERGAPYLPQSEEITEKARDCDKKCFDIIDNIKAFDIIKV